jgi:hypothetical protein
MGGLPCAKAVIDNGRATEQTLKTNLAAVERALGCMTNSILLGATADTYPTEELEDKFIQASGEYKEAVARSTDKYLAMVASVSTHFDGLVTEKQSGKAPPPGHQENDSKK